MYKDKTAEELTIEDLQLMALDVFYFGFGLASKDKRKKALKRILRKYEYDERNFAISAISKRLTGSDSWYKDSTFFFKVFERVSNVVKVEPSVPKQRSPREMAKREGQKIRRAEAKRICEERKQKRYKDFYDEMRSLEKCKKMNADEFYASWEWKRVRYEALKRHGAKCMLCGATANDGARICVDHIKPRAKYPELQIDIMNLQILCNDCNMGKGRWDETDWAFENWKNNAKNIPEGTPPF